MNWIRSFCFLLIAGLVTTARAAGPASAANVNAAVAQTEAGDVDTAAQALSAGNLASKGSLAWYHQSALTLLGRAEELKVAGEYAAAQRTAAAAIRILQRGDTQGATAAAAADRAQLYVQLAMTYDHFFGDRASARQYYQSALQLRPDLATAKSALAAYDADAARLRKLQGGN